MSAESGGQSYSNVARTRTIGKKIVLHLSKDDKAVTWNVSRDDLSKLVYEKMGIPDGKIEAIDDSMFRKIIIYLKPGVDNNEYLSTNTFIVKPGLKCEPTRQMDGVVSVKIFWTPFDLANEEIKNALAFYGDTVGDFEYMNYGKGNTAASDKLRHIKTGNRVVNMKIKKNIPSYIVINGRKAKILYNGQIKSCARCHFTADNCPGLGDASKCEEEGGERRDLLLVYDKIIDEAVEVNIGYELNAEYMDIGGFPEDWVMIDVRDYFESEGIEVTLDNIARTDFKGVWRIQGKNDEFYKTTHIQLMGKKLDHKHKLKVHSIKSTPEKSNFQKAKEAIDEAFKEDQKKAKEERERKEKKEKEKQEKLKKKEEEKRRKEKEKEEEKKRKEEEKKKKEAEKKKKKDEKNKKDKKDDDEGGNGAGGKGEKRKDEDSRDDDHEDSSDDDGSDTDDETFTDEKKETEQEAELGTRPEPIGSPVNPDDTDAFRDGIRRCSTPDTDAIKVTFRKQEEGSYKVKTPAVSKREMEDSPEVLTTTTIEPSSSKTKKGRKQLKKLKAEIAANDSDFIPSFQYQRVSAAVNNRKKKT